MRNIPGLKESKLPGIFHMDITKWLFFFIKLKMWPTWNIVIVYWWLQHKLRQTVIYAASSNVLYVHWLCECVFVFQMQSRLVHVYLYAVQLVSVYEIQPGSTSVCWFWFTSMSLDRDISQSIILFCKDTKTQWGILSGPWKFHNVKALIQAFPSQQWL